MTRYLAGWAAITLIACAWMFLQTRLTLAPLPDAASSRFAYAALAAARSGAALPQAPASARSYRPPGPIFVSVYAGGQLRARHVGDGSLAEVVLDAARRFGADPQLKALQGWADGDREYARFRVAVTRAQGALLAGLPPLSVFSLVPMHDGVEARAGERTAYLIPDDLLQRRITDKAVIAPVPDLTFGTSVSDVRAALAEELAVKTHELQQLKRLHIAALPEQVQADKVDARALLAAARDGVRFVLRHQENSGRFTYIYDAQRDEAVSVGTYSTARHAGTMFFLARAAAQLGMPEARAGAMRALEYVRDNALARCGAPDRLCVEQRERQRVEFGGSALTALACAELLRGGDSALARSMLVGLLEFIRAQQRPDGELMHEYSRAEERPRDVQHMYYSGEAALALLSAYEQLKDPRDLEAARRLMSHLTGAGWEFFGARYYYGEEHWTCQAVAKAAAHLAVGGALDFCLRWGRWQEKLQYRPDETPWDVAGAFGVGPVLVPRVTTAASRVEALVPIYRVAKPRGHALDSTRELIELSLGLLLRMRWAPGPAHLFARPSAALGGSPSTAADLRSRVDMVQHAGSAMLAWAEVLAAEASP